VPQTGADGGRRSRPGAAGTRIWRLKPRRTSRRGSRAATLPLATHSTASKGRSALPASCGHSTYSNARTA